MIKKLREKLMAGAAAVFIGMVSGVESVFAQDGRGGPGGEGFANGDGFNSIIGEMQGSLSGIPGLISGIAYMMGILLGVLGILKIKDHVEDPGRAKLQEGAIRLIAGGGLFALPIVFEAMRTTIGDETGATVDVPAVKALNFETK